MKITNNSGISLPLAVWLVHDEYDYVDRPNYISATTLMKPIRHIVLPKRLPADQRQLDVSDLVASALGSALHSAVEKAWLTNYKQSMRVLGYPQTAIDRVRINPTEEGRKEPDIIPVYLEQRSFKEVTITVNGKPVTFTVGGKYDMVTDGIVNDTKSTSAYTWLHGGRDDEHQLQGSIYRWLNPDIITEDFIRINYLFTDWQKVQALSNPAYPQSRLESKDIPLLSIEETDAWIRAKLSSVAQYLNIPEDKLPYCTDTELWRSATVHKYYSDPANTAGKSTKNFELLAEANAFKIQKGKGVVITVPGEAKRCGYCDAYPICTQKDALK